MKWKLVFAVILSYVCLSPASARKPWPRIHNVVITASVTVDGDEFGYSYAITNPARNKYPLSRFELDLRVNPQEHPLSRQDLTLTHTADDHMKKLEDANKYLIDHEFSPEGWILVYVGLWGVEGLNQQYMIQPGKTLLGYKIVCEFPPGIREFVVDADSWYFFANPEEYDFPGRKLKREGDPDEFTTEVNKGIHFFGKTIAPVATPEPFTVSSWTARMTVDAKEARSLGWIKSEKNLIEIKELIAGLNTGGLPSLKAAVQKIEKYVLSEKKKGNLTNEADALIRLSAQYLLRRLEKPEEKQSR